MPTQLILTLAGLGSALTVASTIGWVLQSRSSARATAVIENLNYRIRTWWIIVLLLSAAALAGPAAVTAVFALLSFGALREFLTVTPIESEDRRAVLAIYLAVVPVQYLLALTASPQAFSLFIPIGAFIAIPTLVAMSGVTRNFLARTSGLLWALMVCVYSISYVPALLRLDIPGFEGRQMLLVAFLLVIAQASDVLQYVWGKLCGRHKVAPALSPSKTVEGFVGGVACASALGAALSPLTPFSPFEGAVIALVIAVTGFLGGLISSAIKRDRGLKDWSQTIPGHGGVLDRIDSLVLSAPVFFHLTHILASI